MRGRESVMSAGQSTVKTRTTLNSKQPLCEYANMSYLSVLMCVLLSFVGGAPLVLALLKVPSHLNPLLIHFHEKEDEMYLLPVPN